MQQFNGYLSYAPMPEGFQGDMDEFLQQSGQNAIIYINGNFLTGLYYPTGTVPAPTLPTSDQGPILLNGQWYVWDPVTTQYLPQTLSIKVAGNYCKNAIYQVQQTGASINVTTTGATKIYDLALARSSVANVLAITADTGPLASADNDLCLSAIKYTVNPTTVPTLAATDLFAHEHLIEGSDIARAQGQPLSLSFSIWVTQTGHYSAYIANNGRDMSYVFSFNVGTANQWTRIKVNNIPALPTGTGTWNFSEGQTGLYLGIVMGCGSQWQTATPGVWLSGFYAGTSQNINMVAVNNAQMKISGVKLEASPSATYMNASPFEADYAECTRYYFTTFTYQSLTAGIPFILQSHSNNNAVGSLLFNRRMCKVPTTVPYGWNSHNAGNVTNLSTGADVATATLPSTQKGAGGSIATTSTKGDTFACLIVADARLS
jgi:hypothetical protein